MDSFYSPTINEIIYNRKPNILTRFVALPNKFHVGERVRFSFFGAIRCGLITNAICDGGLRCYNIEAPGGRCFREIPEQDIINTYNQ